MLATVIELFPIDGRLDHALVNELVHLSSALLRHVQRVQ